MKLIRASARGLNKWARVLARRAEGGKIVTGVIIRC